MIELFGYRENAMRAEMERLFPLVLTEASALCAGDMLALLSKTFEQRAEEWEKFIRQYEENPFVGNFFSDTIKELLAAKEKAYLFRKNPKAPDYAKYFKDFPDVIISDLLTALLINRSFETPTKPVTGFNIREGSKKFIDELLSANDDKKLILPKDITLDYVLRAILKKQLAVGTSKQSAS